MDESSASTVELLLASSRHRLHRLCDHEFFTRIVSGRLSIQAFSLFLRQELYFLPRYANACSLLAEKLASNQSTIQSLLLDTAKSARQDAADIQRVYKSLVSKHNPAPPVESIEKYTRYLITTAQQQTFYEACSALSVCIILYPLIAGHLQSTSADPQPIYESWIKSMTSPRALLLDKRWRALINGPGFLEADIQKAFKSSLDFEIAFFDSLLSTGM